MALSIAEALSAIALLQYINPGCPVAIGTFTSNVDMKSGAPAFGTPEYMRATQMTGQLVRFYGVPMRSSGVCAGNVPDAQSMWETCNSLWAAVQSGTNMVYHAAGWLEGGLIASPEKFVMDCEVLQMIQRYFEEATFATTDDDLAFDAIKEVGAGGHYFGCQHTQDRYQTAFYAPFWPTGELRGVAGRRVDLDAGTGAPDLQGDPGRLRGARNGRCGAGGADAVRGTTQAGGRGADRFLTAGRWVNPGGGPVRRVGFASFVRS